MLARKLERHTGMLERLRSAASCSERLGPHEQPVGLVEVTRERQVIIRLLMALKARGQHSEPHPHVPVTGDAVPDELVSQGSISPYSVDAISGLSVSTATSA